MRNEKSRVQLVQRDRTTSIGKRLMTASEIAEEVFRNHKSPEWVRRNLPGKIAIGHSTVMWFEDEAWEWVNSRREGHVV